MCSSAKSSLRREAPLNPFDESLGDVLERLRDRVFAGDEEACFIEREEVLADLGNHTFPACGERVCATFEAILGRISTPIDPDDVFVGRIVEGRPRRPMRGIGGGGSSHPANPFAIPGWMQGHMTLHHQALVDRGLAALAAEARATAAESGDGDQERFAGRLGRAVMAIGVFAGRYALAAHAAASAHPTAVGRNRLERAANALERVPLAPAANLFEALQSIWLVHLIFSAVVGGRDFAFGRLDQILYPLYNRDLAGGMPRKEAVLLLAHFMQKTNEITGLGPAFGERRKPIPCMASKQYLVLAGGNECGQPAHQDLSHALLEAAKTARQPEPDLYVRWHPKADKRWRDAVADAAVRLQGQVQIVNEPVMLRALTDTGLPPEMAWQATFSGCCRVDLPGEPAQERYHNAAGWLVEALGYDSSGVGEAAKAVNSMEQILDRLKAIATENMDSVHRELLALHRQGDVFHVESLLLRDCPRRARDAFADPNRRRMCCHFFAGIATIADSLAALDHFVFGNGRMRLPEFLGILASDFAGHDDLVRKIARLPKFGNHDDVADRWAARAGRILVEALPREPSQWVHVCGFFSLNAHVALGKAMVATPDGRRAGMPISENQSPGPGADRNGPTALLGSLARLPFDRTPAGGLNLRLTADTPPAAVRALIEGYFGQGGLHLGITAVDRAVLEDARLHPERHRDLLVRITGFSERFVTLPQALQDEIIARTTHRTPGT